MAIGMGNLLDAFVENGLTNHVKGGILHMSRPPQAVEVESEADLEALGELPAGSIAYTSEYAHMWQLTGSGTWAATEEKGGSGGGAMVLTYTMTETGATFGATYAEVKAAMMSGRDVVYVMDSGTTHMLFKLIMCEDATDFTHGDQYIASFYNPLQDNPEQLFADTEDGELYISYGG